MTIEAKLEKLASTGLLPEKSVGKWRATPKDHVLPGASGGEINPFKSFIERGLALPTSKFFRCLLHFYGLTVNHVTPNGTTGFRRFVECLMHSAKATLPSAKPLPRAALGKEPPVKNPSAKNSLPIAFYRALGKVFAECNLGTR